MKNIVKTYTRKSAIYHFCGWSDYYHAYVSGAFVGKFIVPLEYDHLVSEGFELDALLSLHDQGKAVLQGRTTVF